MNETPGKRTWWIPGPEEVVFGCLISMILIGDSHGLLADPGTPWHLRLGREILVSGTVPRHDTLTFTHQGESWVDQSWGFDVLLAGIVDRWGWPTAVCAAALGLAWLYTAVARGLARDGTSPVVAVVTALLVAAIGGVHFLLRPHLFTFAFVYLTLRACQRQHERGGYWVALVPLYTAILANLHGGFVALPVIVLTAAFGHAISGTWGDPRAREVLRFAAGFLACLAAGLVNPYGFGLYRHVAKLLYSSGVTSLIIEYQPAPFGKPEAEVLEWVLLALVALPVVSSRRVDRYQLAHVLVWLHLALTSIRNAPFFALAAAPAIASLLDGLPILFRGTWKRDPRWSIWPACVTVGLLGLAIMGRGPGSFDPKRWPFAALPTVNRQPLATRMFHEQDWGGLIAAECQPTRRSYLDDRFELYGKPAIVEYIEVLSGGPTWDLVQERDRIDMVWLRPDRGLARRLFRSPGWRVVYQDKVSVLFKQAPPADVAAR